MKNLFSFFKRSDINLTQKWWHRLCIVLYVVLLIAVASSALIGHFHGHELVRERSFNIVQTQTWSDYVATQNQEFSEAEKKAYNTFRSSGMSPEDAKRLAEKPSYPSFVRENADKVGCFDSDGDFKTLTEYSSDETREKICDGESSIIAYNENWIYHVQGIVYVILLVLLWAIAVQFLYYKIFLYIIFGTNKDVV